MSEYPCRSVAPGFYVCAEAHHPMWISNALWFYRHGWRGINIDADPGSMRAFCRPRPWDMNLGLLMSDQELEMAFQYWNPSFMLNTVTPEHAHYSTQCLDREPERVLMKAIRLDSLLAEHVPTDRKIDSMTLDVERHDLKMLRSNDWHRFRQKLMLVEAHGLTMLYSVSSTVYQFLLCRLRTIYLALHSVCVSARGALGLGRRVASPGLCLIEVSVG